MDGTLKNKTIKGVGWGFVESISGTGITFLVGLILARILTPKEFGVVAIIMVLVAIFNTIVNSGFSSALIRKKDIRRVDYDTVFIFNIVFSVFLCGVLYLVAPFIAAFFKIPQVTELTRVMSVVVVINSLCIVQQVVLIKKIDFKTQAKVSISASLSSGIVGVTMALMGFGVWSLVAQQISRQLLRMLLLWIFGSWRPVWQFSKESFNELFGFGWKILLSGLIDTIWKEVYQLVIGKWYNPATLGQYERGRQFANVFSANLTLVVQKVTYPVLSEMQDDIPKMKKAYQKILKMVMFVTFCCMLGLVAIAKPMILVLIGEKWLVAVGFLQIISFSMMLYPLHAINLNMLQVQGRSDLFLYLEIIKKTIAVIPILLGIFVSIYVMLLGSVVIGLISYFLNSYYSGQSINYGSFKQLKDVSPSFLVALLMAIPVYVLSFVNITEYVILPLQILLGVVLVVLLSRVFKVEEYFEIKKIVLNAYRKLRNRNK